MIDGKAVMEERMFSDIDMYRENVLLGMDARQTLLGTLGCAVTAVSYFLSGGGGVMGWLAILLGLPCFLLAFARPGGMRLESFIAVYLRCMLLTERKRYFACRNLMEETVSAEEKEVIKWPGYLKRTDRR